MVVVLVFCLLGWNETAILVLKSGQKMQLATGYKIEQGLVLFENKGQLVQLPIGVVDLDASESATNAYHAKRKALLNYKPPPPKKRKPLPDTLYRTDATKQTQTTKKHYQFDDFKEEGFAEEEDYFQLGQAWQVYERGIALEKDRRLGSDDTKAIGKTLAKLSKSIWACKSSEKRRGNLDELAWEGQKRRLKEALAAQRTEAESLFAPLERKLGIKRLQAEQP